MREDTPAVSPERRGTALLDPRFLVAVVVLVVNDYWAKGVFGNVVTGKLSDFAGLIVFPVVIATIAQGILGSVAQITKRILSRIRLFAVGASGMVLAVIKLSPEAAGIVEDVLGFITRHPHQIIVDPTDLIGLFALGPAWLILGNPRPFSSWRWRRFARAGAFTFALVACLGSSSEFDGGWTLLEQQDEGTVVAVRDGYQADIVSDDSGQNWAPVERSQPISADELAQDEPRSDRPNFGPVCLTNTPQTCVRTARVDDGSVVEESRDGGSSWATVWSIEDTRAGWITEEYGIEGRILFGDIAILEDDTVLVTAAHLEPLRRDAATGQWSPTPAQVQTIPTQYLAAAIIVSLVLLGGVRRLRIGDIQGVPWICAAGVVGVGGYFVALDTVGPGTVLGLGMVVVSVVFLGALALNRASAAKAVGEEQSTQATVFALLGYPATAFVVSAPLALFANGAIGFASAWTATRVCVAFAPLVLGFLTPRLRKIAAAPAPPPPPSTPPAVAQGAVAPATVMSQLPPPTGVPEPQSPVSVGTSSVAQPAIYAPTGSLLATPFVAGVGAAICTRLLGSILMPVFVSINPRLIDGVGPRLLFFPLTYGALAAYWIFTVVTRAGLEVPNLRARAIGGSVLSVVVAVGALALASVVGSTVIGLLAAAALAGLPVLAVTYQPDRPSINEVEEPQPVP